MSELNVRGIMRCLRPRLSGQPPRGPHAPRYISSLSALSVKLGYGPFRPLYKNPDHLAAINCAIIQIMLQQTLPSARFHYLDLVFLHSMNHSANRG